MCVCVYIFVFVHIYKHQRNHIVVVVVMQMSVTEVYTDISNDKSNTTHYSTLSLGVHTDAV